MGFVYRLHGFALAVALLCAASGLVYAGSVDAQFDKTGDGYVDAADWQEMSTDEKAGYARASVTALGQSPDARLEDGRTVAGQYLDGLNAVYGDE